MDTSEPRDSKRKKRVKEEKKTSGHKKRRILRTHNDLHVIILLLDNFAFMRQMPTELHFDGILLKL